MRVFSQLVLAFICAVPIGFDAFAYGQTDGYDAGTLNATKKTLEKAEKYLAARQVIIERNKEKVRLNHPIVDLVKGDEVDESVENHKLHMEAGDAAAAAGLYEEAAFHYDIARIDRIIELRSEEFNQLAIKCYNEAKDNAAIQKVYVKVYEVAVFERNHLYAALTENSTYEEKLAVVEADTVLGKLAVKAGYADFAVFHNNSAADGHEALHNIAPRNGHKDMAWEIRRSQ